MTRMFVRTAALVLTLLFLSGCFLGTPDEMYALPKRAGEYLALDDKIQETMRSLGAEYAAPLSGGNTQTVQLQDLDGDGVRESAFAFFRVSADEKPLKIYIFRRQSEEQYEIADVIEGEGTAINSISYENLGGTAAKEVVISWQMSANVHMLVVYQMVGSGAVELMRTGFTRFRLIDIDADGTKEIITLQLAEPNEGGNRAELYDFGSEGMAMVGTAPMSGNVLEVRTIRSGMLTGGAPALFVPSTFGDGKGQLVDVFALRDGALVNITLSAEHGYSVGTVRNYTAVAGQDINLDSIFEIPIPEQLPEYNKVPGSVDYWSINWRQYDLDGNAWPVYTTYHNVADGWYLILPEAWRDQITVTRRELSTIGERRVTFSRWNGEETEPTPFLTIYMLSGANRAARAAIGNRQTLLVQSSYIYACEFLASDWDCGVDAEDLKLRFDLIRTEWTSD